MIKLKRKVLIFMKSSHLHPENKIIFVEFLVMVLLLFHYCVTFLVIQSDELESSYRQLHRNECFKN